MMASSQVEIATSSSPFGCAPVHHRRDSCFQNNENPRQIEITDLWVHQPQWQGGSGVDGSMEGQKNKDKWARAREMVFPVEQSQSQSQSGGGVSSLVQKWKGLEAEAKSKSKSSSTAVVDNSGAEDDSSLGGWESDRTAISGPSSCRGGDSDFTERERLRVADIIRKLTDPNEVGWDSPPRVRTSWEQSEQRCASPVVGSPRIRGRHAYIELLTQMERDRRKELERLGGRKAVSQFSHRDRIQALLRVRFLRRGMEAKEGRVSITTSSDSPIPNHSQLFREVANPIDSDQEPTDKAPAALEFYAGNEFGEDKYQDVISLRVEEDRIQNSEETISSQGHDDIHHACLEANDDIGQNVDALHSYEQNPFSKFIRQEDNSCRESSNHNSATKSAETTPTFHNTEINSVETPDINEQKKDDDSTNHQVTAINHDLIGDCANPQSYHGEEEATSNEHIVDTDAYWVSDVSHPEVGWEELHSDYQQNEASKRDWIGEVSRPRSDWEDLRQARYQEMLDPFLEKEEIRALLSRKSVSTFLSSGMKEKIDQLMMCRSEGQRSQKSYKQIQEEKDEELPEQIEATVSEEGEVYGDYYDGFGEGESSVGQRYNESDEYMDQMTSSPAESWPQKSSDFLYQIASPSTQLSSLDNGPNTFYRAHPAIEMELIYDLRRHMEQLHQEMTELRKSIKCCTDMQMELKHSIKKEVATHPDTKNGRRNPLKRGTSGGRCSVCCKVQVDCVLYRCGHMCTCFKCAHELQWSSGKCPVCRAPIMDVVRIYSNY